MAMLIMVTIIGHTEKNPEEKGEEASEERELIFGVDPSKNPRDKSPSDENKNTLS